MHGISTLQQRFGQGLRGARAGVVALIVLAAGMGALIPRAQDAFNLPAELYLLYRSGQVERYGVGVAGVSAIIGDDSIEVLDFGVAPDNVLMAYRTNDALTLLHMSTGDIRQIDGAGANFPPYRGRGETLAWSPDGEVIAMTTEYGLRTYFTQIGLFADVSIVPFYGIVWSPDSRYIAGEAEDNLWWVYRRDGFSWVLHTIVPSSVGLTWVDTDILMFAPVTGGLFLMDLANANAQARVAGDDVRYRLPLMQADFSVAVFGRRQDDADLLESAGYLHRAEFVVESGWRVTQVSDESVDLDGLHWTPDGGLLVAFRGGALSLVQPASALGVTLPPVDVVAYGWGAVSSLTGTPVNALARADDSYFLADDFAGVQQIWLAPRDGSVPFSVTALEDPASAFAVAGDGETFAYASGGAVWLLPAGQDDAVNIALVSDTRTLSFNGDGSALVYDDGGRIFRVTLGGDALALEELFNGYTRPRYVGRWLQVTLPDGDLALYDFDTRDLRRLGGYEHLLALANGELVGVGVPVAGNAYGIYRINLTSADPAPLLYAPPDGRRIGAIAEPAPDVLRVALTGDDVFRPTPLIVGDITLSGGVFAPVRTAGYWGAPLHFTPDGGTLAGRVNATGTLAMMSIVSGQYQVLSQTPPASAFVWWRAG